MESRNFSFTAIRMQIPINITLAFFFFFVIRVISYRQNFDYEDCNSVSTENELISVLIQRNVMFLARCRLF